MPKLEDYQITAEQQPTRKRKICNLQSPPNKTEVKKEPKAEHKAESISWATEVEQQYPLDTIKEEQHESSQYNTEPLLITSTGKPLNKRERQRFYIEKEEEFRRTIEEEAKEKANDDLSNEQYQSIIRTMAIKLPPMNRISWELEAIKACLLYTSPSPRDRQKSRMPSSA